MCARFLLKFGLETLPSSVCTRAVCARENFSPTKALSDECASRVPPVFLSFCLLFPCEHRSLSVWRALPSAPIVSAHERCSALQNNNFSS